MSSVSRFDASLILSYVESPDSFPVPFEGLWQSCGYSRKDHAVRHLKKELLLDEDFTSFEGESSGGRPSSDFRLTADAAKVFAVRARTDEGVTIAKLFVAAYNELKEKANKIASFSPSELILYLAQQNVENERKIKALEMQNTLLQSQMHIIEVNQDETRLLATRADNEVMRYRHGRMENGDWFSVKGWARLHKVQLGKSKQESQTNASKLGTAASKWCRDHGIGKETAFDPDYGTIGVYPQEALIHAFAKVLSVITTEISA